MAVAAASTMMPPTMTTVHYDYGDVSMLKTQITCNMARSGRLALR